ncbi:alpha/beta hydrolase [Bacillus sp. AFS055030]|uniref:alpha/beta hydrolase n=1 Tax=Bacillus sp. AFS055030 TaxID=2033507 RepID=UPI000BFE67BE|nr:alpha/beta hydrolase [Bacillus sp. AFS055030]PGL73171.1 alpha/beta hydrolase [Bacillus sp. AFS055030]
MKRTIKLIGICLLLLIIVGVGSIFLSPRPVTWFLKKSFAGGMEVEAADYGIAKQKTTMETNIEYSSKYRSSTFDLIKYKGDLKYIPTIFWIHGGAFVAGDKEDVRKYATYIASHGYNVVNINYPLAPSVAYPIPLQQIDQAYKFVKKNAGKYGLDLNNIYIAGDSAGAQLTAQFVSIQMNKHYSDTAKIAQSVNPNTIRGAILLCGPYDMKEAKANASSKLTKFVFKRVGWAYFGKYNWEDEKVTKETSLLRNVPEKFVSTFITDGNTGSFESQGKKFAALLEKRTGVKQVFYRKSYGTLGHEYQFQMNTKAAQNTFNELLNFLNGTKVSQ